MSDQKLFQVFQNKLEFDPADYLVSSEDHELTDFQKKAIENATAIMKENIVGEVKSFGGSIKANEEKFKELEDKVNEELSNEDFDDLKKGLKGYVKILRELIEKSCVAIIPLKEMPWVDVIFRTVPRIVFDKKVELLDNSIAYYGEVKCILSRSIIFGKTKGEKPLFAPIMGTIDLGSYKLDESQKEPKSQIYSYVSAIISSLDSTITRNHLAKYHEAYQRHGDPICDFLMKDNELMNSMERITSGLESNRISSDIAVYSIAVPHNAEKATLLLILDEGKDPNQYSRCFEALLRFSAESCNVPSVGAPSQQPQTPGQVSNQQTSAMRTPGGQELKVWTAEELASEAQKRMESKPDIPEWTEEELTEFATERGTGLPEGMEVWTEEELQELARKRQGGLDIPEWEPDKDMKECVKCGYALRPGWSKCPHCETPVGAKIEPEPTEQQSTEEGEKSKEESEESREEIPPEEPELKEED
ncbi:MAG: zinc ribbon domain-containing protein [Promethearchaeota archaeon]